ncbi:mucin-15 [Sardina pilchardus]|uniref:mucin-15 n=1 Tax=Sardina pilchardus TaxID=27697 RepID=UPI002E1330B8
MTRRQDLVLALCLILQSLCGVLLQDPPEYGDDLNNGYPEEYITRIPVVALNDVEEAEDDRPADDGLAFGSMMYSDVGDAQTNVSVPTLMGSEEEGPSASSDTVATLSPMLRSDDSLEEDASVDLPSATPEPGMGFDSSMWRDAVSASVSNETSDASATPEPEMGFDPSMWRDGDSLADANSTVSVVNGTNNTVDTSTDANSTVIPSTDANSTVIPSTDANSTEVSNADSNSTDINGTDSNSTDINGTDSNSTDINGTDTNSTDITGTDFNSTDITGTDFNSTDVIDPSSGTNSSNVTNPLNPGPTNPPGGNDTMGGLNPATENPADSTPEPTGENIPSSTAGNIPERTAEYIPTTTTESAPELTAEVVPNDTAPPSGTATALAKAAAAGNAEQGVDSGTQSTNNGKAWGVILGLAVAVGIVGLVMYVLLKRRERRNFSHSKLVEEAPGDPVLRLDNGEPLDLKYDGFGYHNPSLQGDDIQMSNYPSGRPH